MPGLEVPAVEVGTEAGGFRIRSSPVVEVHLELWGYWPLELVNTFTRHARGAAQRLVGVHVFTLNAKDLKPQGSDGQEALRECFRLLSTAPFTRGRAAASNALTKMQLTRLFRECGLDGRMQFVDSV